MRSGFPLPASRERKHELLQEIFQKLAKKSEKTVIIVEGKRIVRLSENLGLKEKYFA